MPEIIPNWHPIFVHFTVALLVTAFLFHLASALVSGPRKDTLLAAGRWNLAAGIAFTLLTVATGLLAYGSINHDTPSHLAMTDHRNWALGTATVFIAIAGWAWFRERASITASAGLVVLLGIATALVTVTAYKGGELVYRHGLGVMSMPEMSTGAGDGHDHEHAGDAGMASVAETDDGHEEATAAEPMAESTGDGHAHEHAPASAPAMVGHSHGVHEALSGEDPTAVADLLTHAIQDGDEAAVLAILAPDVLIFETGGAERSAEEYQGHHMPADMAFLSAMEIEPLERKSGVSGDSAWVSTRARFIGTFRDSEIDLFSTETLMMQRRDGMWRVTHIHWSSRPAGEDH